MEDKIYLSLSRYTVETLINEMAKMLDIRSNQVNNLSSIIADSIHCKDDSDDPFEED